MMYRGLEDPSTASYGILTLQSRSKCVLLALHSRLNTRDAQKKRSPWGFFIVLCTRQLEESLAHILFDCPNVKTGW